MNQYEVQDGVNGLVTQLLNGSDGLDVAAKISFDCEPEWVLKRNRDQFAFDCGSEWVLKSNWHQFEVTGVNISGSANVTVRDAHAFSSNQTLMTALQKGFGNAIIGANTSTLNRFEVNAIDDVLQIKFQVYLMGFSNAFAIISRAEASSLTKHVTGNASIELRLVGYQYADDIDTTSFWPHGQPTTISATTTSMHTSSTATLTASTSASAPSQTTISNSLFEAKWRIVANQAMWIWRIVAALVTVLLIALIIWRSIACWKAHCRPVVVTSEAGQEEEKKEELKSLPNSQLQQRARQAGASEEEVDDAIDGGKPALEAGQEEEKKEELTSLPNSQLQQRARQAGASDEELDAAINEGRPALIKLILSKEASYKWAISGFGAGEANASVVSMKSGTIVVNTEASYKDVPANTSLIGKSVMRSVSQAINGVISKKSFWRTVNPAYSPVVPQPTSPSESLHSDDISLAARQEAACNVSSREETHLEVSKLDGGTIFVNFTVEAPIPAEKYIVCLDNLAVHEEKELQSTVLTHLRDGTGIILLEIAKEPVDRERRARIAYPAGWITTSIEGESQRYVKKAQGSAQLKIQKIDAGKVWFTDDQTGDSWPIELSKSEYEEISWRMSQSQAEEAMQAVVSAPTPTSGQLTERITQVEKAIAQATKVGLKDSHKSLMDNVTNILIGLKSQEAARQVAMEEVHAVMNAPTPASGQLTERITHIEKAIAQATKVGLEDSHKSLMDNVQNILIGLKSHEDARQALHYVVEAALSDPVKVQSALEKLKGYDAGMEPSDDLVMSCVSPKYSIHLLGLERRDG
jgi:hypothetical protein